MNHAALYLRPSYLTYGPQEGDALTAALDDLTRHTLPTEVNDLAELRLDPRGCLAEGYRFTSLGLRQVCTVLAPGLFQFIRDLAGCDRDADSPREEYDLEAAVKVYNQVLRRRFERLAGRQRLLRNTKDRLIEGVLGPRFALVENSEVLERAAEAAASREGDLAFRHAVLAGRRMTVRYVAAEPLFKVAFGEQVHTYRDGLHFTNSEVGGESTFRAASVLYHKKDDAYALGTFLSGKQVHVGRRFAEKMAQAFAAAAASRNDPVWLRKRALAMFGTSLGLDGTYEQVAERQKALVSQLRTHGVASSAATRAVALAAAGVAYPTQAVLSGRTQFDLFRALTVCGRSLYATPADTVEQTAYALLTGKLKLK